MSGILLLAVIGVWIVIVCFLVKQLSRRFKKGPVRVIVVVIVTVLLLALPVADEIVSAPQFNRLCEEEAGLKFDPERIRGRTIIFEAENSPPSISVGLLNGYFLNWRYLDLSTREVLITEKTYNIRGGVLIRGLGISERDAPLIMPSYCGASETPTQKVFLDRYDLKFVDEKAIK